VPDHIVDAGHVLIYRLKQRRLELGWSQAEVAQRMDGRTRAMVSNWESGRFVPRTAVLMHWAEVLGLVLGLRDMTEGEADDTHGR
jgi:transcriptional regulator with XRE-family HTH domain